MKELSKLIRLARKKKGNMPMVTVAKKAGISYGVMQKIESGAMKTYPDRELLQKLCSILDIDYGRAVDCIYDYKSHGAPEDTPPDATQIPVFAWGDLKTKRQDTCTELVKPKRYILSGYQADDLLGVIVGEAQDLPNVEVDDVLIIEPTAYFTGGDWVIVYDPDKQDYEVRVYEQSKKGGILKSFDPKEETGFISVDNKDYLFGVVLEVRRHLRMPVKFR